MAASSAGRQVTPESHHLECTAHTLLVVVDRRGISDKIATRDASDQLTSDSTDEGMDATLWDTRLVWYDGKTP